MKKLIQQIGAAFLCIVLLSLTACSGKTDGDNTSQAADGNNASQVTEKGRYLESEYTLPEEEEDIAALERLEDGSLRLVSSLAVYRSDDMGKTWEKIEAQSAVIAEKTDDYAMGVAIDSKGRIFAAYYVGGAKVLIDTDGNTKDVNIDLPELEDMDDTDNTLHTLSFTSEGYLVGSDYTSTLYEIDVDNDEILRTYKDIGGYDSAVVGDKLVVLKSEGGIEVYSREKGAVEEAEPALKSYFESAARETYYCGIAPASDDTFYYADTNGLYRYTFGASEMELLISGNLCSLGNPANAVEKIIEGEDHTFLIIYSDEGTGKYALKQYEYSAEASATPKYEISLYSLEDSDNLRSAIANFQSANPDYYINLEIGMSGEDGITASDAISTLNTNIMAGNGPDILMLEGLPYESYMEKGLLADLSELVEKQKQESSFYEDILTTLQREEGLYGIPTRFKIPVIEGVKEDIDAAADLASLRQKVQELRSGDGEIDSILGTYSAEQLLQLLFNVYQTQILTDSGTVDEASLSSFLEESKEIFDVNQTENAQETEVRMYGFENSPISARLLSVLSEAQKMNAGWLESVGDLQLLATMNAQMGWDHNLWKTGEQKTFIPLDTMGINAKSGNIEGSELFIKYLLSDEVQSNGQMQGLPVNKNAMDLDYEYYSSEEQSYEMAFASSDGSIPEITATVEELTDEAYAWLRQAVEEINTPVVDNAIISDAVIESGTEYLNGQIQLKEAVDAILKTVNLYLSE